MYTSYERWMRDIARKLLEEKRWGRFDMDESVLEHSFKMAWIVQLMLALEDSMGNPHRLKYFWLLQCAVNHDLAEAVVGDKVKPEVDWKHEQEEKAAYTRLLWGGIPHHLHSFFPQPLDREPNWNYAERRFWEAAEHIGYAMFACEEMRQGDIRFVEVWKSCEELLRKRAKEFYSVQMLTVALYD